MKWELILDCHIGYALISNGTYPFPSRLSDSRRGSYASVLCGRPWLYSRASIETGGHARFGRTSTGGASRDRSAVAKGNLSSPFRADFSLARGMASVGGSGQGEGAFLLPTTARAISRNTDRAPHVLSGRPVPQPTRI